MESTGEANRIQISEVTARILETSIVPLYNMTPRDPIAVKGIDGMMSNFWLDSMTESHSADCDVLLNSIRNVIPQMLSEYRIKHDISKSPNSTIPWRTLIKCNSNVSFSSLDSSEAFPSGIVSLEDIKRITDTSCNHLTLLSLPTTPLISVLIVSFKAKARLHITEQFAEAFGGGINFSYADSTDNAMILISTQNYSVVLVDASRTTDKIKELLTCLKKDAGILTMTFNPRQNEHIKRISNFSWSALPSKDVLSFDLLHSSLPIARNLINNAVIYRDIEAGRRNLRNERKGDNVILLIMNSLPKLRMVRRHLELAASTLSMSVQIMEGVCGKEAIEKVYATPFIDLIFIDSALSSQTSCDVSISEIIFHCHYAESSNHALTLCLTSNTSMCPNTIKDQDFDFFWTVPLVQDKLTKTLKRILS